MNLQPANEPNLLSSLGELRRSLALLKSETRTAAERPAPKFERLKSVIEQLGQTETIRPLPCPEEYLKQWQEMLAGRRAGLEWRAVRALCWEPKAATDLRFQRYLDREWPPLRARALQGMIRACHMRWSPEFAAGPVVERVRQRLNNYDGGNRLLKRWQPSAEMLLGAQGAVEFAKEIIRHQASVAEACRDWRIDEQTAYAAEAAEAAFQHFLTTNAPNLIAEESLTRLLRWNNWPAERFKRVTGKAILHRRAETNETYRQMLVNCLLNDPRLGDPRLQASRWSGVAEEAKKRFIRWLSREDIVFFFDHVAGYGDPHGRRDFWLRYISTLAQSRSLLKPDDEFRLSSELRRRQGAVSYGRIKGAASAFLLDFGKIVAIEFHPVGAIYFYEREQFNQIIPHFWQQQGFSESNIKRQWLAKERIPHIGDWQYKAATFLAQYGIRPN
ncbi:MAG TPA: EH signature domain-containing protein [Blastocatellia bacterium]